jgi:metal-responsive CopG/Arc/MetJ family transcriptional regulator
MREIITISIRKELRRKIDEKRGDVARSKFLSNLLEQYLGI